MFQRQKEVRVIIVAADTVVNTVTELTVSYSSFSLKEKIKNLDVLYC